MVSGLIGAGDQDAMRQQDNRPTRSTIGFETFAGGYFFLAVKIKRH
jgi:hypothetical protein